MVTSQPGLELELYRPVGGDGGLSGLDARLLEFAAKRMTGEEMAAELGIEQMTPARCLQRVREILKAQNALSRNEQKALLLLDLVRARDTLFDRIEGTETKITKRGDVVDVESDPRHMSNLIRLLREWRGIIDSMQEDIDSSQVKITKAYADMMMRALEVVFRRMLARLAEEGFEIPEDLARDLIEELLPLGFQALEEKIA